MLECDLGSYEFSAMRVGSPIVLVRVHIPRKRDLFRWNRLRKPKNRPRRRRIRHAMTMPAIPPEDNEATDNPLMPWGSVLFPGGTLGSVDEVDEGGRIDADGRRVNEELDVWERDSVFDELD
jgi:hypothetical protein